MSQILKKQNLVRSSKIHFSDPLIKIRTKKKSIIDIQDKVFQSEDEILFTVEQQQKKHDQEEMEAKKIRKIKEHSQPQINFSQNQEEDSQNVQSQQDPQNKTKKLKIKIQSLEQGHSISQSNPQKKKRKIRTTITVEKLKQMNRVFDEYRKNPQGSIKLKQISERLDLGYSTVLHKYKQFKKNNQVKGGALIQSLFQKRKYKKSLEIEEHIKKALQSGNFFTANQLASFIKQNYGKTYSRSIISRHLGEMGYSYKNIKTQQEEYQQEKSQEIQILVDDQIKRMKKEQVFSQALLKLIENKEKVLFLADIHFQFIKAQQKQGTKSKKKNQAFCVQRITQKTKEFDENTLTLIFVANSQQLCFYRFQEGLYSHNQFYQMLRQIIQTLQLSQPSSQVQQNLEIKPQKIQKVQQEEDSQNQYFFEKQPNIESYKKKQEGSQKILLQGQQIHRKKHQTGVQPQKLKSKTPQIPTRFLVMSFNECHIDSSQQQEGESFFNLLMSHNIIPLYFPEGEDQNFSMVQLWYQEYLQGLLQKKYKSKDHFIEDCQKILISHAYEVEQSFDRVVDNMESIIKKMKEGQKSLYQKLTKKQVISKEKVQKQEQFQQQEIKEQEQNQHQHQHQKKQLEFIELESNPKQNKERRESKLHEGIQPTAKAQKKIKKS